MKKYQKTIKLGTQSRVITVFISDTGRHDIGTLTGGHHNDLDTRVKMAEKNAIDEMITVERALVSSHATLLANGFSQ